MSPISDPITTINWPFLKQEVEQDPDNVRELALSCPICYELMSNSPDHSKYLPYHEPHILPCGHIIGQSCLEKLCTTWKADNPDTYYYPCPVCKTKMRDHWACSHRVQGRRIPSSRAEYAYIPPVLSQGGVMPPRCTRCTVSDVLDDLASYGRLLDSEVRLGPDQSIAFRVYIPGKLFECHSHPDRIEGEIYGLRRNLEIPSDLESIWSHAKQLLQIQSARFWFEMDVGAFEFAISVFELYP